MTDVRDVADRLGFRLDEAALDACRSAADDLAATAEAVDASDAAADEFDAVRLDAPHDALLWGYESPRRAQSSGPLSDLRVAVKDNTAVRGLPLTCGSDSFSHVPCFDATVVERLLADGAALVGKANMDAFAFGPSGEFSGRGTVENPHDLGRVPGGSSSGSGAAVAAGTVDVALGTDTGGSVRIPAACCGVVGHKPTYGRVSTHGVVPFAPSLDTVGPLARDVATARRAFASVEGRDDRDATTGPGADEGDGPPATVGVPEAFLDRCSEPVRESVARLAAELEGRGEPSVVELSASDLPLGAIEEAYLLVGATEFSWYVRQRGVVRGVGATYDRELARALAAFFVEGGVSDHVAKRVLPSAYLDAARDGEPYVAARQEVRRFADRLRDAFEAVDALLVPTVRTLPPELGNVEATEGLFALLGNTAPFNLSGHPATTVPVDGVDGLPVSVQVVTPRFADERALAGAMRVEELVTECPALTPPAVPTTTD